MTRRGLDLIFTFPFRGTLENQKPSVEDSLQLGVSHSLESFKSIRVLCRRRT